MKVYLDNILLTVQPIGLGANEDGLQEVIELDLDLHGYVLYYEFPLTFIGDGWSYLYNKKKQDGFCSRIEVRIEDAEMTSTGFFFLTDANFKHTVNEVEVEITDSTFGIFISEAKDLKISPASTLTRSSETLVPVTASNITLFTPSTGVDLVTDAKMFEIADTLEHIVSYLSDNGLQFSQSYFGGTFDFYLGNHFFIRNRGGDPDIQFSFRDLMHGLFKLFGIWFKIDNSTVPATFTLVQGEENFFGTFGGITIPNIRDLTESFYPDRFFSTVAVGDKDAIIERGSTYQLPTVPLVGFREEIYNAEADCSLENELDLKSPWTIDHNQIEKQLITAVTEYEETPVLIYVNSSTLNAHKGTYALQGAMRYYNEEQLNVKVLERHSLNSNLTSGLGADTDSFLAYKTNDTTSTTDGSINPADYDDDSPPEGFDTGGNYDTVLFRYVIPTTGSYKFSAVTEYIVNSLQVPPGGFPGDGRVDIEVIITRKTAAAVTVSTVTVNDLVILTPTSNVIVTGNTQFFAEATDYIEVSISWDFLHTFVGAVNSLTIKGVYLDANNLYSGTHFKTLFIFNNGGTVDTTSLLDYKASALKFDGYPINATTWKSFRNDPSQGIHINNGGNDSLCWIKKIKRNRLTGESECEMISSPLLTNL